MAAAQRRYPWTRRLLSAMALLLLAAAAGAGELSLKAWPFLYYAPDEVAGETRLEVLWPLYVREQTKAYTVDQVLSVPQNYPDDYERQVYFAWPLTGLRLAPEGHDAWLFPLAWSGSAPARRHLVLFPAFYYYRHLNGQTLNLGLLLHNHWEPGQHGHFLFPLAWSRWRDLPGESYASNGLLPLCWFYREDDNRTTTGQDGSLQTTVRSARGWWLTLAGYGHERDETRPANITAEEAFYGLLPLYYQAQGRTSNPGRRESREFLRLWLFPWYHKRSLDTRVQTRTAGEDTVDESTETVSRRDLLFPLFWDHHDAVAGPKPTQRDSQGLFPLYAWMAQATPDKRSQAAAVLLYWQRLQRQSRDADEAHSSLSRSQGLFPFFWDFRFRPAQGAAERATYLIPLGARLYKEGEYSTQNLLGPLFTRCANSAQHYTRYDVLFPVLKLQLGDDTSGGRLFPLAGGETRRHRYRNGWYLFPLGWNYESQPSPGSAVSPPRHGLERWRLDDLEARQAPVRGTVTGAEATRALLPLWWDYRADGADSLGLLPFFTRSRESRPPERRATTWYWPLLCGRSSFATAPAVRSRHDFLFSAVAWGGGEDYRLARFLPLFSYTRTGGNRDWWSLALPFSYTRRTWVQPASGTREMQSALSIPFSWLPWFRDSHAVHGEAVESKTHFFPFFSRERDRQAGRSTVSVLWPLFRGEWKDTGETRVSGLGGVLNYRETDINGFTERRLLYRLWRSRSRSWLSEQELMPFYSRARRSDGTGAWSVLGGLVGAGTDSRRSWVRLLYVPITIRRQGPADGAAVATARREQHADYALKYMRAGHVDRAALEFMLAGDVRAGDAGYQLAAGEAYLRADTRGMEVDLRESLSGALHGILPKQEAYDAERVRQRLQQRALPHFERALALGADPRRARKLMARCRADLGDKPACAEILETLWRQHGGALDTGLDAVAAALKAGGKSGEERADACLRELRDRFPASPTVLLLAAERLVPVTEDTSRLQLLQAAAAAETGAEEDAWLAATVASDKGANAWLSSGLYGTGLGPFETARPQVAAIQRALAILARQASQQLGKAETRQAALPCLAQSLQLLQRQARLEAHSVTAEPRRYQAAVSQLVQTFSVTPLAAELLAALKDAERDAAPVLHQLLHREVLRLEFARSYLTAWRLELQPKAGQTPAPPRTLTTVAGPEQRSSYVNLDALFGGVDACTCVATCIITSPEARDAVLWLGFDHELTVELNGQPLFGPRRCRLASRDEFQVRLPLKAGRNVLRLTVKDDRLSYGFYARLANAQGEFMPDVQVTTP